MKLFFGQKCKNAPKEKMPQKLPYLEATYSQTICLGLGKVAKIVKFRPIWSPCFTLTNLLLNHKHLKDID
jgi:hypothetical protein